MLVGEAGERYWDQRWKQMEGEAILWTMLNRLYLHRELFPTYTDLILKYSQPINPIWRDRGTAEERRRRAVFATMRPDQAPPAVVDLVTRFMQGKVFGNPYVGLVHFIAPTVEPQGRVIGPIQIPGMQARSNVFFKTAGTVNWPLPSTFFKFKVSPGAFATAAGITLLAIGSGIAYYYWLKAKRFPAVAGLGDTRSARLRAGKLHCPYCEGDIQCEMPPQLCGPDDAASKLFSLIGKDKNVEAFWVFLLDHRGRVTGKKRLSTGSPESVLSDPRSIFRAALMHPTPTGGLITVHNHTIDDSTPSQPDLDTTHMAVTVGNFMQLPVVDHLVIGSTGEYTSIRDYVESRYGENAFQRTMITPGGEAPRPKMTEGAQGDVKGLFSAVGDID